jgi:hypothetical protein
MNANARPIPEINLEEFERRLRAAGTNQGSKVEDPLEELTRLVNVISLPAPPPAPAAPAAVAAPEPQPVPPAPALASAVLRSSFDEGASEAIAASQPPPEPAPTPVKSRARGAWRAKVAGLVVVAAAMAAGAVWLKVGVASIGPKSPPFILAAAGPSKVAPPDEKAVQSAADVGALLNKDSTTGGPVKVVNHEERPVDVNAGPKTVPPAPTGTAAAVVAAAAPATVAAVVESPVAPTTNTPIIAPSVEPAPPTAPAFAQRKPVKTVSVRPDGTLLAVDSAPVASAALATPTPAPSPSTAAPRVEPAPTVAVEPASPTLGLPAPKPPKPTARPVVGKTDTTAPAEPVNAPLQLSGATVGDKPQKPPTRLRPPEPSPSTAVASAATPAAGDFAVQLAAPRSEADARSAIQRFQSKYSDALGETELGVRKASDANGDAVYRVRTAGMSKADAQALCQKLKADGGDCFVARN